MQTGQCQCKQKDGGFAGLQRQSRKTGFVQIARQNRLWSRIAMGTGRHVDNHTGNASPPAHALEKQADEISRGATSNHPESNHPVQLQPTGASSAAPSKPTPHPVLGQLSSTGHALSVADQQFFGQRLNHDFSDVKIHTNENAADSAESLNARAYTTGNHIVFNRGEYRTGTGEGSRLLAHELVHVVQQNRGSAPGSIQKQDKAGQKPQPVLINLPVDGIHLKVKPSTSADNFPGDKAVNGDVVIINNSGGAGTYNAVKNGDWAWIEIPGKSSPDPKYPTLHGFIETRHIEKPKKKEEKTEEPEEKEKKETKPYNNCVDSPAGRKYSIVGKGDSSQKYQNEIDRLEEAKKTCPGWKDHIEKRIKQLETYKAERGNSTLADCDIAFRFDGHTLYCGSGGSFAAISGKQKTDSSGDYFDYSKKVQQEENGPIPEGGYWLKPEELKNLSIRSKYPEDAWGSHHITIHPFETTPTFGRGGFFIHGGKELGSVGCIDVVGNMSNVADIIDDYEDCKIKLTVKYAFKRVPA